MQLSARFRQVSPIASPSAKRVAPRSRIDDPVWEEIEDGSVAVGGAGPAVVAADVDNSIFGSPEEVFSPRREFGFDILDMAVTFLGYY